MPYVAFSLKWRPQSFDEVIGQEHVTTTLKNAISKDRLACAYLFAGPRGVGKTSVARIFAKALNCVKGPTSSPCQKCPACLEITQSRSLDVIEIDGASNRGIDEIRQLRENVKFAPTQGKYKIYIIDEVHMLTTEAFNALLKTLEEPPEFVKFIFATTHPHKVIPTVLSRCQRFDFLRIPAVKIIAQLEKIIAQEKVDIDKEVVFSLAKAADGSLRDAESMLDQLLSFSAGKISSADVNAVLGIIEQDSLFEVTSKIIDKDSAAAVTLLNKIVDQGKDPHVFLANLIEHFRNLMILKVTSAKSSLIDLPQEYWDRLFEQASAFSLEEIFSTFNQLVNTQEIAKRFSSSRIPIEIVLVKLCQDKHKTAIPAAPKNAAASAPAQTPQQQTKQTDKDCPEQAAQPDIELEQVKTAWTFALEKVGASRMSLATYLNEARPIKWDKGVLTIGFAKNNAFHKETLEEKENRLLIEKAFSDALNLSVRVNFILTEEIGKGNDPAPAPAVQQAIDAFGARLIRED